MAINEEIKCVCGEECNLYVVLGECGNVKNKKINKIIKNNK